MDRAPATGSAAFGELQSRLARQFGHTTFSFLSAISCRKAENVWPHCSHSISISSLILFPPRRISQPLQSVSAIVPQLMANLHPHVSGFKPCVRSLNVEETFVGGTHNSLMSRPTVFP